MNYLKIFGCIMIFLAISLLGLYKTFKMKLNINVFLEYNKFLRNLKSNISLYELSLAEIFNFSQDTFSKKLQKGFFVDNFKNCVELFKKDDDSKIVLLFLENLGRTNTEEQVEQIELQIAFCSERIKEEKTIFKEKAKANIFVHSFLGMAVALVLL